jgi:hypothetical protein
MSATMSAKTLSATTSPSTTNANATTSVVRELGWTGLQQPDDCLGAYRSTWR